jgi:hypothetical protein
MEITYSLNIVFEKSIAKIVKKNAFPCQYIRKMSKYDNCHYLFSSAINKPAEETIYVDRPFLQEEYYFCRNP